MASLYDRIILLAKKNEINGNELGALLGLKKSPLTDWKNGKSTPTLSQLVRLCDIFAVSSDYLLFGNKTSDDKYISNTALTPFEQELLSTYAQLDQRGQHRVHTVIYEELDRIKNETAKKGNYDTG